MDHLLLAFLAMLTPILVTAAKTAVSSAKRPKTLTLKVEGRLIHLPLHASSDEVKRAMRLPSESRRRDAAGTQIAG